MKIDIQLKYLIFSFLNSRKKNLHTACFWYLSSILTSRISMISWKQLMLYNIKNFWFVCLIIWYFIFSFIEILIMRSFQIILYEIIQYFSMRHMSSSHKKLKSVRIQKWCLISCQFSIKLCHNLQISFNSWMHKMNSK